MMSVLISDDHWTRLLEMAGYSARPDDELAASSRNLIEVACSFMRDSTKKNLKALSFAKAADCGEDFLAGCFMLEKYIDYIRISDPPFEFKDMVLTEGFIAKANEAIRNLRNMQIFIEEMGVLLPNENKGPNSKHYLHFAVRNAYEAWMMLKGGRKFVRKDFLLFAHAALEPARRGVTEHSVAESFDRHVRPERG